MASDLIYREDAKDYTRYAIANGLNVLKYLGEVPAAAFRPVVRGEWVNIGSDVWECSACGYGIMPWNAGVNFCPNCGADMRDKKNACETSRTTKKFRTVVRVRRKTNENKT